MRGQKWKKIYEKKSCMNLTELNELMILFVMQSDEYQIYYRLIWMFMLYKKLKRVNTVTKINIKIKVQIGSRSYRFLCLCWSYYNMGM